MNIYRGTKCNFFLYLQLVKRKIRMFWKTHCCELKNVGKF